jgi:hypothetical protein
MVRFFQSGLTQFAVSTLPLLVVLLYFLYRASRRVDEYNTNNYYNDDVLSLMDMLIVFLCFHMSWTVFTVYVTIFLPKRRHFLGRYLTEGQTSMGDIIYDKSSRLLGGCCGCWRRDYGYALYPHPIGEQKVIRKRVRVYQRITRERVAILRLPNRPLSGQPKVDIEMKLSAMKHERDSSVRFVAYVAVFWLIFALAGSLFVLRTMIVLDQYGTALVDNEDASLGRKLVLLVVGINIPFAFVVNWIRFLLYRNWMVNRGAILGLDHGDPRKIQGCLVEVASTDGSDPIPYSILGEDHSYTGTLPSHSGAAGAGGGSYSRQDDGGGFGPTVGGRASTFNGMGQWRAQSMNQTTAATTPQSYDVENAPSKSGGAVMV